MKGRRAARPYAKALLALAKEREQAEEVGRELADAATAFATVAHLRDVVARPWVPAAAKRDVAREVAQRSGLSTLTSDFLVLVAGRGRIDHLPAIVDTYQKLLDEDLRRVRASVRTAVPLTGEARRALSAKLTPMLGDRHVVLEEIVDPTMLGGFIVESHGVVLDASLEGQLEALRRHLGETRGAEPQSTSAANVAHRHAQREEVPATTRALSVSDA